MNIFRRLKFNSERFCIFYLILASLIANIYFYITLSSKAIGFGDGWSRMNIARRVVDSLTPGLSQLGGVWLPFPQLLILPFVSVNVLYFQGIAGAFISSPAFLLGGIYLYKSLEKLTKSILVSVCGSLLYASNLNLLYIQTTPMSEALFICSVFGAIYHFLIWQEDIKKNLFHLIFAGFWTLVATLTRFEGYLLLLTMIFSTVILAFIKSKKVKIAEGVFFIFTTLAAFGIFLWCIYSWAIFGDPLNWLKIYSGERAVISTVLEKPEETWGTTDNRNNLVKSVTSVMESSLEMNGILYLFPLFIGSLFLLYFILKRKSDLKIADIFVLLIAATPPIFLIVSSFQGASLVRSPPINLRLISNTSLYFLDEYNLRYGLLALPFFIIFSSIVFSYNRLMKFIFLVFSILQILFIYIGKPVTIYSFPHHYLYLGFGKYQNFVKWFKQNYNGGLILSSAIANDQLMYSLKIPYKSYIYEGTGNYWKESVIDPTKFATWIMFQNGPKVTDPSGSSDFVSYYLQDTPQLTDNYDLVYVDKYIRFYKIEAPSTLR